MATQSDAPDLILHSGLFTTLDRSNPTASAVAVNNGVFSAVGRTEEIMPLADRSTHTVNLQGQHVLPGLIDNHLHIIRGGLNYNMELRWDGIRSLADAMAMLKRQVAVTPPPQWVRVVGGFTAHQFVEKRLPTIEELNAAAPDTPVFLLHLYDRAFLNAAALRATGYTKDTPEPPAGEIVRDGNGSPTGLLLSKPNAAIVYATLARGPEPRFDYQVNSTRHFVRELNLLGLAMSSRMSRSQRSSLAIVLLRANSRRAIWSRCTRSVLRANITRHPLSTKASPCGADRWLLPPPGGPKSRNLSPFANQASPDASAIT